MSPRTLTAAPTDRSMWRRLLKRVHPDHGGDDSLFVWTRSLYEYVAGDAPEDVRSSAGYERRQPPPHPTTGERLDFSGAYSYAADFEDLTARAVSMADSVGEPYAGLLRMLASCYPAGEADVSGYRAQHVGASYKQLAYVAHLAGMSVAQRTRWYRICESVPLAQRHAGHLIKEQKARAA